MVWPAAMRWFCLSGPDIFSPRRCRFSVFHPRCIALEILPVGRRPCFLGAPTEDFCIPKAGIYPPATLSATRSYAPTTLLRPQRTAAILSASQMTASIHNIAASASIGNIASPVWARCCPSDTIHLATASNSRMSGYRVKLLKWNKYLRFGNGCFQNVIQACAAGSVRSCGGA